MATEVGAAPSLGHLQSVQKAMALPTVGAAVEQVGAFYTRVKGAHSLLEWALSTAEAGVVRAATTAAPYVAAPLAVGDAKVAAAIGELERRVPIVTEPPKVIVETTKQAVLSKISPQINKVQGARLVAGQRVKSLKELSWAKANALLSTAYGQKAVHTVDAGATYAMQMLNHYLPPVGEPEETSNEIALAQASSEPAMHAVQTVGRLSAVAARRVWANLAYRVNELRNSAETYEAFVEYLRYLKIIGIPVIRTAQAVGRLSAVAARLVLIDLSDTVYKIRNSGIELDPRRYLTALLAALHLANVTSEQQKKETDEQEKKTQNNAEPTPPPTASKTPKKSSPTTARKVKSTPESKSTVHAN